MVLFCSLQVATQLFILHEECSQGNYETVNRLAAGASQSKAASAKSVKVLQLVPVVDCLLKGPHYCIKSRRRLWNPS